MIDNTLMRWLKVHCEPLYAFIGAFICFMVNPDCILSEENSTYISRLFVRIAAPYLALAFMGLVVKDIEVKKLTEY
jgi:hypothetical protein